MTELPTLRRVAIGGVVLAVGVAITASFTLLRDIFYFGIWQTLDGITAGTWLFATGWLLKDERSWLGRLLVVLGGGVWAAALMTMLDVHSLAVLGAIFGVALVLWLVWTLIDGRRRPTRGVDGTPGAA